MNPHPLIWASFSRLLREFHTDRLGRWRGRGLSATGKIHWAIACGLVWTAAGLAVALAQVTVPDPQFRVLATRSGNVTVHTAVDMQGRVLISGRFDVVNGVRRAGAARLETNGAVDPFFTFDSTARPLPQPDGGTLLWYDTHVRRLRPDGTLDPAFEIHTRVTNGVVTSSRIVAVHVETDGRIWVAGDFVSVNGVARPRVARLFANGAVDPGFVPELVTEAGYLGAIAVQSDGRLVGGRFPGSYDPAAEPPLFRLNPDGSLDRTFQMPAGDLPIICVLAVRQNGNILVGGAFSQLAGVARFGLVELRSDGKADVAANSGLGAGGEAGSEVRAILPLANGGALVAGYFGTFGGAQRDGLVKLRPDGSVDPAFDATLSRTAGVPRGTQLLASPFGVVVAGVFDSAFGSPRFNLFRLLGDETLDTSFAPDIGSMIGPSIAASPDGRLLMAGSFNRANGTNASGICLVLPDGRVDPSFRASVDLGTSNTAVVHALFPSRPDGTFWLAGAFQTVNGTDRWYLARLHEDGSLATNVYPSIAARVTALAQDSLGRLLVGTGGTVRRLLTNGLPDRSFPSMSSSYPVVAIVPSDDGILVVRERFGTNAIVRLTSTGYSDPTYHGGTNFSGGTRLSCAKAQPDGKVLVGGGFFLVGGDRAQSNKVARLLPDGALDPTFRPDPLPWLPTVDFLQLEPGGRIVVGSRRSPQGRNLARLNPDGSLDPTFSGEVSPGTVLTGLALAQDGLELFAAGTPLVPDTLHAATLSRWVTLPGAVLSVSPRSDGRIPVLRVGGLPEQRHRIEFSDDLNEWFSLGILVGDCMPPCEIELDVEAASHRFYRAVLSP